ncbi:uncharacterized protein LOC141686564 [Apium graveolens]|uniref:uncharacterized protein LOC141686564 n=1 Tax=Apium graveolens TaxID=4045 RepID=UPI003D79BB4C
MASSNNVASSTNLASWIPAIEISDEEYKLFHTVDMRLFLTLINTLGRNSFDSISVIAFLLWLERSMLSHNTVQIVNQDWPNQLIDMLADQAVALLECLKNLTLFWEMCGDISMIQELCNQDVGFVYLHPRRLEVLRERTKFVSEMAEKAFKDLFPN